MPPSTGDVSVPAFRPNFVKVSPYALMIGECGINATYGTVGDVAGPALFSKVRLRSPARLTQSCINIGALVTGHCRDEGGALAALEMEHYPGMAEAEITRAACEAAARWPLEAILAVHRYGLIPAGRGYCSRRYRERTSRRGFCGGVFFDGLSKNRGAVLEVAAFGGRRGRLGRGEGAS